MRVSIVVEKGLILIDDNRIVMDKTELSVNLGTIAKSGTSEFLATLEQTDDKTLIGQFGVGFYSAFLVADHVSAISRKVGTAETDVRKSEGCGYLVCAVTEEETHKEPGTTIVLHLKNKYFIDEKVLRELIMKYREFIHFLTRMMGLNEI